MNIINLHSGPFPFPLSSDGSLSFAKCQVQRNLNILFVCNLSQTFEHAWQLVDFLIGSRIHHFINGTRLYTQFFCCYPVKKSTRVAASSEKSAFVFNLKTFSNSNYTPWTRNFSLAIFELVIGASTIVTNTKIPPSHPYMANKIELLIPPKCNQIRKPKDYSMKQCCFYFIQNWSTV